MAEPATSQSTRTESITLSFKTEEELALYDTLVEDAEADERTPSKFIIRYLKTNILQK